MRLGLMFAMLSAVPALAAAQDKPAAEEEKPVTKVDLEARLQSDYADLDADKDGKVTPDEVKARLVKSAEAKIEAIKKERDAAFARLDANGDGSISKAEFEEKAKLPTMKEADAQPFLDRFDANKDGTISEDEFREPTLSNFARMDKNKDGEVTELEIQLAAIPSRATPAASGTPGTSAPTTGTIKKPAVKSTPPIRKEEPEGR